LWPSSLSGKFVERRPSTSTRVDDTPRLRSDTAAPPAEKPLVKPLPIEPAPSAEAERIASVTLVMPARSRFSAVMTVTGNAVWVSDWRKMVPVTTMSPSPDGASCCGAVAPVLAGASCASAGAAKSELASTRADRAAPVRRRVI